ncbi:carboxymuconolactone decarboxylase family protein [Kluyvera sichuanensis]|uniref:carboxymuconolactone decarboxylase family protein n=1 Tax=Kluyvera sichuanensis TaxID=2725494 RepID=UPI003F66ACB5
MKKILPAMVKNKTKSMVFIVLLSLLGCIFCLEHQSRAALNIVEDEITEMIINEFITDKNNQLEISRRIFAYYPGLASRDSFLYENMNYEDRLRKKYANGNYFTIISYTSVDEFKKINPNCCAAITVSDSSKCIYRNAGDDNDDGKHICVFLKIKVRYLDQNNTIQYVELPKRRDTAVIVDRKGKIVEWILSSSLRTQ